MLHRMCFLLLVY